MKLYTDYRVINITNKDLKIKDEFSIKVKVLTYKENLAIMESITDNSDNLKMLDTGRLIFIKSVIEWKNITDSTDKELECSDENKGLVFDFNPDFCQEVLNMATKKVIEDKKK
jgi:hypothetical protein